ncbi:MAG: peptidase S41, partial [Planctomycetes bacterium]|nr:peptidase S41 [Planctomycetota bacterium]
MLIQTNTKCTIASIGFALTMLFISGASAIDTQDTRLLAQPAVSAKHLAFVYAEDLWVCLLDGTGLRRLTTHPGVESDPCFSKDGQWIAFSGQYDGNIDVYLVSVDGGIPQRLTWHPAPDQVQAFSPDGKYVLFTSDRAVHTRRFTQLFEVPVTGGHPIALPIPNASKGTYSPDGKKIAYLPNDEVFLQWKNYRGGTTARIWLYDREDHSVEQIPQPEGRCNDTDPMWHEGTVYFRSDRNGEFNLFAFEVGTQKVEQLTDHEDFPILNASLGPDHIAYEQAGYLHLYDLFEKSSLRLKIGVPADLIEVRPRYVSGNQYIRSSSISPSGSRAVFGFRGEIVTVPAKKGDVRNLTSTPGVHEHTAVWSPDGISIACFSDASGEYALNVIPQNGKGQARTYALQGAGFYDELQWSPDSRKVSFSDNSWTLYWLDLETGVSHAISTEPIYGPQKTQSHAWSPDSRWIAYTQTTDTYFQRVFLYNLEEMKSCPVTDGLSDVGQPVFDAGGKYLYMTASTDAGPVRGWFAMSNADMEMTNTLYLAVLRADEPSPFKRESDEEEGLTEKKTSPEEVKEGD